jgi:hypothetical protein
MTKKLAFGFRLSWNVDRKVNPSMIRFMLRTMVFFCLIGEIWGEMVAENDSALLPFLALGFFCGIRPNGELEEIEWRDISLDNVVLVL